MKKLLLSAFLGLASLGTFAQTEYSVFTSTGRGVATTFETDYHATGINPANLGFKRKYENKHVTFGLFEIGASAYSSALEKKDFRHNIFRFGDDNFTYQQKQIAAKQFVDAPVALNADINWFGISYQNDKIGGFAFNVRETARWYSSLNQNFSDVLFMGYKASYFDELELNNGQIVPNDPSQYSSYDAIGIKQGISNNPQTYSQLFNGSTMSMIWYREYALSYGKEFVLNDNFALAGGIGIKYLQGFGMTQIEYKDNKVTSTGAFSPVFDIDFGQATLMNPTVDSSSGLKTAGKGMGFDFGFNVYYKEKIKFGIALTNVGSISWDANVYQAMDTTFNNLGSAGFDSYNIFREAEKVISSDGFLKWQGSNKIKTNLPTALRIGASHQLDEDRAEIGVDFVIPLNNQPGTLQKPYWAVGGDFKVLNFLKLSSGVSHGGNYSKRVNIPVGITFIVGENGTWEFGVASRDAVTYFRDKGPAISVAFGFLRFRA